MLHAVDFYVKNDSDFFINSTNFSCYFVWLIYFSYRAERSCFFIIFNCRNKFNLQAQFIILEAV